LSIIATGKTPGLLEELSIEAEFLSIIYPDKTQDILEEISIEACLPMLEIYPYDE
jgi:hypothetical protein